MSYGKSARNIVIIGMDAATLSDTRRWAREGHLPNLQQFFDEGAHGVLRTVTPTMSPAAWSTFATGLNPGKHGVLDFSMLRPDSYERRFVNAATRRGRTFWEIAGKAGIRGGVLNVPVTYPPRPFNGFLVSGMLSPALRPGIAVPASAYDDLTNVCPDYEIDLDCINADGDTRDALRRKILRCVDARRRAAVGLYRMHRPPLYCAVFIGIDRAYHYLWDFREIVREVYEQVDRAVGELIDTAGRDANVVILSDHGAVRMKRGLNLAQVLADAGLLTLRREGPLRRGARRAVRSFARLAPPTLKAGLKSCLPATAGKAAGLVAAGSIDLPRSRAYPTGQSQGVFVNLAGRQPEGVVPPDDYEAVREEIIRLMRNLQDPDTGEFVFRGVHRREEVWSGPCVEMLPDVVLEQRTCRYDMRTFAAPPRGRAFYDLPPVDPGRLACLGGHHHDGLLLAMGPDIRPGRIDGARIADVPATILAMLGLPVPAEFDGRVLDEMLTEKVSVKRSAGEDAGDGDADIESVYTSEDQAALVQRLRSLGYM